VSTTPSTVDVLSVHHLHLTLRAQGSSRTVLHDVSLSIGAGEALGLVGESGSGKSMTAKSIMRLLSDGAVVTGEIRFLDESVLDMGTKELLAFRRSGVAMIYQDPRAHINPVRTIGDFLTESLVLNEGMEKGEAVQRVLALLDDVGIVDGKRRLRQYPHQLSGGLLQRVMIAAALSGAPRLLLADEPTTALDVTTQEEVMAILDELRRERSLAMLFITHDLDLAAAVTDRVAVMYAGVIVEIGDSGSLHTEAMHPYTAGLLASRPDFGARVRARPIPGRPIQASEAPPGCVFAGRCPHAVERCVEVRPQLRVIGDRSVACHRAEELRGNIQFDHRFEAP
jgi:oligopeptide/dipeptide ABC transporter ATP-binding protein